MFEDDKDSKVKQFVNKSWALFFIVWSFSKKILWFGSCATFMYMMPIAFEVFTE